MDPLPSVLFVASECAPLARAGGLGDVVGALPVALRALGHDARVVIPRYGFIDRASYSRHLAPLGVPLGPAEAWCAVDETRLPGSDVPVYLLDHEDLFGRPYLYDPPGGGAGDNLARFALLSRGALQLCKYLGWTPDVFHVHDWPSSLVPVYLNTLEAEGPLGASASVLTVHNIAHQTKFPGSDFGLTHLPEAVFRADGLEDHGAVNPLKGGLYHATMVTAVSPRYAWEMRTPEGGAGLDGVCRFRGGDLVGILNGIDDTLWDPATDPHLEAHFSAEDLAGKALCKLALQRELGLEESAALPLLGVVARLVWQKGQDVILDALDALLALDAQVVILGAGSPDLEHRLRARDAERSPRFRAVVGFDDRLAHRIEAASDLFLMPSRFEPSGLNQLYSQRYGALPVVRATGGLLDSVENHTPGTDQGTGFVFWDLSPETLTSTVAWALEVWRSEPEHFLAMQQRAMRKPLGWSKAAERYAEVYRWALGRRRGW
ncbi:MAG: glycogen synthase [Deltaproteobacteria bacterium]|nr:glycogen synthase [Deltaproteobacteria bacterium]